jgi:hypothetical protein
LYPKFLVTIKTMGIDTNGTHPSRIPTNNRSEFTRFLPHIPNPSSVLFLINPKLGELDSPFRVSGRIDFCVKK